jgi:hypothetical protein
MIRIACPASSKDDVGESSLKFNHGVWGDAGRKVLSKSALAIERFAVQEPGYCLGAALSIGIALGWWVKRL